jgi:hypothetical protein
MHLIPEVDDPDADLADCADDQGLPEWPVTRYECFLHWLGGISPKLYLILVRLGWWKLWLLNPRGYEEAHYGVELIMRDILKEMVDEGLVEQEVGPNGQWMVRRTQDEQGDDG